MKNLRSLGYYTSQESDCNSDYEEQSHQQYNTVNSTLANTFFSQTSHIPAVSSYATMTTRAPIYTNPGTTSTAGYQCRNTMTGTFSYGDGTSSHQFSFGPPHATQNFIPYNPQMTYANTTPGHTAYTASYQGSATSGFQSFNFISSNQSGQYGNNGQNQPNPPNGSGSNPPGGFNNSNPPNQGGNNFNPPGQGGNGFNPPNFP